MTDTILTGYPSIDKPWLKYYSDEELRTYPPKKTVEENIYDANRDHLNDVALIYFGKKFSYGSLFSEIDNTAKAFISYGVKNGDNVVLCMPATPEAIFAILALNKIGAIANMLNPTFSEEQMADRIAESNATILVVLNELFDRVQDIISKTGIKTVITSPAINSLGFISKIVKKPAKVPGTVSWNSFIKHGKESKIIEAKYEENQPAIIVYSSGTTGASKGIQLTNDSINWAIVENTAKTYCFERGKRYLLQIPIWFSTGIVTTGLVPLYYGVSLLLEPMYDFPLICKHVAQFKPNYLITASSLVEYMMRIDKDYQLGRSWICIAIGGEYAPPQLELRCNEWLKKCGNKQILRKGYGMCECGGSSVTSQIECNVLGTAGVPTPHVVVASFDLSSGKEKKYKERGELRVLTPCRMVSYYNRPDETEKRLHKDSDGNIWVCTGDMGYVSEDGNVTVCGRISDSYRNKNDETVYLFDIDRTILDVKGIKQCKAIAVEIEKVVTHVCHLVLTNDTEINSVLKEIKTICEEKLPVSHRPRHFHVYKDALPVAPSGKLDMAKMRRDIDSLISYY